MYLCCVAIKQRKLKHEIMKTEIINTEITSKGKGQYSIIVELLIDNDLEFKKSFHSTNSQLYDLVKNNDDRDSLLIDSLGGIEEIIRDLEFTVQFKVNGTEIESFTSLEEAKNFIVSNENEDKINGDFEKNCYEIKLNNN